MNKIHIQWAFKKLIELEYQIFGSTPDIIQKNEWAEVTRFETNRGFVFLKKVPAALAIEANIMRILREKFHGQVPTVIASNEEEHCFLMQDAGIQLNKYFKENFQVEILIQAVVDYSKFQIRTMNSIDYFLEEGLPDWRLEKLPGLYHDLIVQENLLMEDGLSQDEIIQLKKLEPRFISICEKLSRYKITDTFSHADFHDKNIVIDPHTKQTTMIDLGEVAIAHPFFSYLNCLHMAKENFAISDSQYHEIKIACFKPWLEWETQEHLFEILALINECWSIHAALGELRVINSVSAADSQAMRNQGRFINKFRHWIKSQSMTPT